MRWKVWLGGLALLLTAVSGCKQQCFLTLDDYKNYQDQMVANLATNPEVVAKPIHETTRAPMTVLDTDREIRYMSLAEAVAISLEQGTVGNPSVDRNQIVTGQGGISQPGTSSDQAASFNGGTSGRVGGSDAIRVLRLDPAIVGVNVEASLTKFDSTWQTSASWQSTDRPVGTALDAFQSGQNSAIVQSEASVQSGLFKPLPSGGVAGITFGTTYTLTNLRAAVNPSYRPTLQFQFEQPLLQGFGVDINQLRASHPGSILTSGLANLGPTNEGILLSRIRFDQQRADFEYRVQIMVSNVEVAYWNLYYAYWNLYAREAQLRAAFETLRITETREAAGQVASGDLALARGRYEDARIARLTALNFVVADEREFRAMLQLRADDGSRIVPSDPPTLAPYQPNWDVAFGEAMTLRPELFQARQEVKAQQLSLIELKNQLLPDLRFTSTYDLNAIGSRLDGPDQTNAFRNLSSNQFNNWSMGLRLVVPVGFRAAHANVRRGELALARAYETLRDSELKIERNLALQYQRLAASYESIKINKAARLAYGEQVRVRLTLYKAGKKDATLNFVLEAQRDWADALSREYNSVRDYNQALVAWEFAKGTALVRNNIQVAEGALPSFAQVRAVEHERQKAVALKIREHPLQPCAVVDPAVSALGTVMPQPGAPLPEIMKAMPLLKDAPPAGVLPSPVNGVVPGTIALPGVAQPTSPVQVEDLRNRPNSQPVTLPLPPREVPPAGSSTGTPNQLVPIDGTTLPAIGSVLTPTSGRKPQRDPRAPTEFGTARPSLDGVP